MRHEHSALTPSPTEGCLADDIIVLGRSLVACQLSPSLRRKATWSEIARSRGDVQYSTDRTWVSTVHCLQTYHPLHIRGTAYRSDGCTENYGVDRCTPSRPRMHHWRYKATTSALATPPQTTGSRRPVHRTIQHKCSLRRMMGNDSMSRTVLHFECFGKCPSCKVIPIAECVRKCPYRYHIAARAKSKLPLADI